MFLNQLLFFAVSQVGDDKVIKQWSMEQSLDTSLQITPDPINTIIGKV